MDHISIDEMDSLYIDGETAEMCILVRDIADFLSNCIFFIENYTTSFLENFDDVFSISYIILHM